MSTPTRQRGVGFVEVLIAVLIISFGFLAVARMQVDSMRNSQSAYFRSQAHLMASAMIDRMRANVDGVRAGHYDAGRTAAGTTDPGCLNALCDPERIARQDLHDWSASLHAADGDADFVPLLPSVDAVDAFGEIRRTGAGRYTVRVVWGERVGETVESAELAVDFVSEL